LEDGFWKQTVVAKLWGKEESPEEKGGAAPGDRWMWERRMRTRKDNKSNPHRHQHLGISQLFMGRLAMISKFYMTQRSRGGGRGVIEKKVNRLETRKGVTNN